MDIGYKRVPFRTNSHRVMLECWESEPAARPTFDWLHTELGALCASWAHFEAANSLSAEAGAADPSAAAAAAHAAVFFEDSANVYSKRRSDAAATAGTPSRSARDEKSAALQRTLYCRLVSPAAASAAAAAANYDNSRLVRAYRNLPPANTRQTKEIGMF